VRPDRFPNQFAAFIRIPARRILDAAATGERDPATLCAMARAALGIAQHN
jgi:hypothetical protein